MGQIIIKAWGKKRVDPGGETRRTEGELSASIRYLSNYTGKNSQKFVFLFSPNAPYLEHEKNRLKIIYFYQ